MAVDAHGMPVRFFLTKGTTSDFKKAIDLIKDIEAKHLLADRGYDSQAILDVCKEQKIQAETPPKRNRRQQRFYDKHLYKHRHLIENAFFTFKEVAFSCHEICKKHPLISSNYSNKMH